MKKFRVVTIDAAAYLVARGRDAIMKAMQRGKIRKKYFLKIGENASITMLDLQDVMECWVEEGVHDWFDRRYEDITRESFVVITPEAEWTVFPGRIDVYSGEILKQRLEAMRTKDDGGSDGQ